MHRMRGRDQPVRLSNAPRPDDCLPLPLVLSDENKLFLSYAVFETNHDTEGRFPPRVVGEDSEILVAVVTFQKPYAYVFGPVDDNAIACHRLSPRGLESCAAWQIQRSSWIGELKKAGLSNRRVPRVFGHLKHFVFTFLDAVFECIAEDFYLRVERGSIWSIRRVLAAEFGVQERVAYLKGSEFDWYGLDQDGHVGMFSSAGGGNVPDVVSRNYEQHDEIYRSIDSPHSGSPEAWQDYATLGFYVYDSDYNGAPYRKVAQPRREMSLELQRRVCAIKEIPRYSVSFASTVEIDDVNAHE